MAQGRKTGGRTKGTPNRVGADVQAAMMAAAERFKGNRAGLVGFLEKIRDDHPETFFNGLMKLLPKDINVDVQRELMVRVIDHTGAGPVVQDRKDERGG